MIDTVIRATGIGGSDIAAIVGLDPRRDKFAVYADKLGLIERAAPSPRMKWGKRIERVIAEAYGEETQQFVEWYDRTESNPERPWQVMTPDAFVVDATTPFQRIAGVDAKNVAFDQAYLWGDDKQTAPDHIALQAHWYMSASGLPWWDIAALFGGYDLHVIRINRDPEVEALLLAEAEAFWTKHVIPQVAPPLGNTQAAADYLRQRFPKNVQVLRPATADEVELLASLKQVRAEYDEAKGEKEQIENLVKQAIGDADGLEWGREKVTWKRSKDTMGTDWESVAKELYTFARTCGVSLDTASSPRPWNEVVAEHQVVTRAGSRKLIVPRAWSKEQE